MNGDLAGPFQHISSGLDAFDLCRLMALVVGMSSKSLEDALRSLQRFDQSFFPSSSLFGSKFNVFPL